MKPSGANSGSPPASGTTGPSSAESAWADFQRALSEAKDKLELDRQHIENKLAAGRKAGKKGPKQPPATGRDAELAGMVEQLMQHSGEVLSSVERQADAIRQASVDRGEATKQQAALQQLREQLDEKIKLIEANTAKELQRAETVSRLQTDLDRSAEQHQTELARLEESLKQKDHQVTQHVQALRIREEQLRQSVQRANGFQREMEHLRQDRERLGRDLAAMKSRDASRRETQETPDTIAGVPELPGSAPGASLLGGSRLATAIALIMLLAAIALGLGVWLTHQPMYGIVGWIHVSPPEPAILDACGKAAWTPGTVPMTKSWRTSMDPTRGLMSLYLELPSSRQGIEQVDKIGHAVVEQVAKDLHLASSTQPTAHQTERDRLRRRIEEINERIEALPQADPAPATSPADIDRTYRSLQAERKQIAAAVAQLAGRITREPPSESAINLDPAQIKNAEGDVKQLQADLTALAQRKQRLNALLLELVTNAGQRITVFLSHTGQAEHVFAEAAKSNYEADVIQKLRGMSEHLNVWQRTAEQLQEVCGSQAALLKSADDSLDSVGVQSTVEQAAKAFLEPAGGAEAGLRQKLQAIGEGGEEPVKRTVLQRNLTQQIQPLIDGGNGLKNGAHSLTTTGNSQLDAVTRTVASLQTRVVEQRRLLESEVRAQALAEARAQFKREVQESIAERDRLLERDRDIESQMSELATIAAAELKVQQTRQKALEDRLELYRQQSLAAAEYLNLTATTTAPAVRIAYIPAEANLITDPLSARLIQTLSLGMGPLVAGMLVLLAVTVRRGQRRAAAAETADAPSLFDDDGPFNGT